MLFLVVSFLVALSFSTPNNPYSNGVQYVNSYWQSEVAISIAQYPNDATAMKVAQNESVFFWVDSMSRITNLSVVLDNAQSYQQKNGGNVIVGIVIYDLPDRDCDAAASNGEIVCSDSACTQGIQTYEQNYITPIYNILQKYTGLTLSLVIEPDSLPNLATNMDNPKCQQASTAYKTCVAYAIKTFAQLSNVYMYVDAAHGGWLGWTNNMDGYVTIVKEVLSSAGGYSLVRGFASNVANYQPLGSLTSTADPCNLESQYNDCINEAIYIQNLNKEFQTQIPSVNYYYITDTSRNGVTDERQDCSHWCNINGAGLGQRPSSTNVQTVTGSTIIDAFVWVKVPGESDGTSNTSSSRYDPECTSDDSVVPAPEAGTWFSSYFDMLVQNAVPPLV